MYTTDLERGEGGGGGVADDFEGGSQFFLERNKGGCQDFL